MPDKEWDTHRMLRRAMHIYINNWKSANEKTKKRAEENLFRNLVLQWKQPNAPRA